MQLVAFGSINSTLNIPNNLAIEYFTKTFINNNVLMEGPGICPETICPEYLEIELNTNINSENLKEICHKVCFEMEIGGSKILSIPLRFMMHLKECEICDNKFYITIPFQMFCDDIKLRCLMYHSVKFILTNTENNFASCNLILKGVLFESQIRNTMISNTYENLIQSLASTEINCSDHRNQIKYRMNFNSIHKGFFIESENVDEINEIKLILNGHIRSNYNKFLIRTKCVKINQHLLYFPLNYDKSYMDRTREGFEGSLNLSRIESSILDIKFNNPQSKICIYGLGSNLLRIANGMSGLAFASENILHNYEEYNENNTIVSNNTNNNYIILYNPITNNDKLICCITHENISINEHYMNCNKCNNNYLADALKHWFEQSSRTRTCPMCRSNWLDFYVYINSENSELSELV